MADLSWHVEATADLDACAAFIERDSSAAATHFAQRVVLAVERLRGQPRMGRVVPEIGDETYRELIFQNYRIVYRLRTDEVVVIGIVHAAMDMERQLEQRGWRIT